MKREYQSANVYEALQERLEYIFQEFDNIYVSFSGGKDSGLLLNMVMDFKQKYYPDRIVGVFHQDFEAQYTLTTEYIERTFQHLGQRRKNCIGYVCRWRRGRRSVAMKCTGIRGMILKRSCGCAICRTTLMSSI